MRRVKNLFDAVISLDNLYGAFLGASQGKRDRREVQEFEYHLETHLWVIRRQLAAGAYQWGAYRRFRIHDPKEREIRAAPFRDRIVHHAVFNVLDPLLRHGFIADTYACIPGRGTHAAVHRYRAFVRARRWMGYRLQGDIKSYFASVDHGTLLALLGRRIGDQRLLALLHSLIRHGGEPPGKGMPIGNLTSQLFANLYLDPFDHFVKETLHARHYIRYMDDFLLLGDTRDEARARLETLTGFLRDRLQLQLNPRRAVITPLHCPCDFLGYVHYADGRSRIRRRSVRHLWRRLPALERRLSAEEISWESARASVASWFGLASHADAFRVSRAIFQERDVGSIGKRLLLKSLADKSESRKR